MNSKLYRILFILAVIVLFINNASTSLWDQDEAAYAGFAYRMIESGNWLVPEFPWSDIHRKPPLHFWAIAASFKIFGYNEFAVRFPAGVAIILTVLSVFYLGRRVFGEENARIASILLFCNPLFIALGKVSVTDASLLFFETVSALSIFNYLKSGKSKYLLFLFIGNAGGLLIKGPPVWILTFGILGILFLFSQYRLRVLQMLPVCLLAFSPLFIWGSMVWETDDGKFISWMIDWYIFQRKKGVLGQTGPPGYFLAVFLFGLTAFASFFFPAMRAVFIGFFKKDQRKEKYIFLFGWIAAGWFIYELIPSKLPAYAIGGFPAVAFLVAEQIIMFKNGEISNRKWFRAGTYAYLTLCILEGIGLIIAGFTITEGAMSLLAFLMGAGFIALGIYLGSGLLKQRIEVIRPLFLQSLAVPLVVWLLIIPAVEYERSVTERVANYVGSNFKTTTPILFTREFPQPSLLFYLETGGYTHDTRYNRQKWMEALKQDQVVITGEKDVAELRSLAQKQNLVLSTQEINGWVSDRAKTISYYVVWAE